MYYHDLLNKMFHDQESANELCQATIYWKALIPFVVNDIEKYGFENFKRTPSSNQLWIGIEPREIGLEHYSIYLYHDDNTKPPYIRDFSEASIGNYPSLFQFNGHSYTPNALSYLKGLAYLKKNVDTSGISKVLEIGGGYGILGEILLKSPQQSYFYVDVDIPPIASISTYYLQQVFGKEAILDYHQSSQMDILDIDEIRKKYRGMVICPWQLPKLRGSFDLAANFVSFQEMEPEVVQYYAGFINQLVTGYLLLRNSRTGKQLASESDFGVVKPVNREDYLEYFSSFDLVALDCRTFGYYTPSGFESEVIVMRKKTTPI